MPVGVGSGGTQSRGDHGFTLVELLVVVIIIGILAAIALPVIDAQRGKAADAATRQDLERLGKRVAGYYLENAGAPVVQVSGGRFDVSGDDVGKVSSGVVIAGANPAAVNTAGWTSTAWCFALTNPSGDLGTFRFSAQRGLETGACSQTNAP